jgi:RNA polymerase sigma factor (sigma-70 family)
MNSAPEAGLASDERLQARWFAEEVQPHEPVLRAYLRRKFPRLGEIDDVVQESYLRLLRARTAGTLRSARAFLFTTARNAALDLFRRRQIIQFEPLVEDAASPVYTDGANAAEAASLNQELEILTDALRDLPERCGRILLLRRIHGLSHKEIAAQLGISEHTVEKQVGIGLRKCVEYFRRRGVIVDDGDSENG